MFETIVVGVHPGDTGTVAARAGLELARAHGSRLHFVYAFDEAGGGQTITPERHKAEQFLDSLVPGSPASIKMHALPGDVVDAILRVVGETKADLVVVGNKGMRGAKRVLGSVPNNVAHHAPCSVLIIATNV